MYHSVTFYDSSVYSEIGKENDEVLSEQVANTWDDWGLIAKDRPFVAPPVPKTNFVDIPGASTKLDFSEALTGYPTFQNRTGNIEFTIAKNYISDEANRWRYTYSKIMSFISGRKLDMVLEDDDQYFYEGRFYVDSYKPGNSISNPWSTISINYDVGPYKWSKIDSLDDNWLWDPFSFVDGVILSKIVKNIPVTTAWNRIILDERLIGTAPMCPIFIITTSVTGASMQFYLINDDIGLKAGTSANPKSFTKGTHTWYDAVFWANQLGMHGNTILYYKVTSGTGSLSLGYRKGAL